jgi:hypothetical protein
VDRINTWENGDFVALLIQPIHNEFQVLATETPHILNPKLWWNNCLRAASLRNKTAPPNLEAVISSECKLQGTKKRVLLLLLLLELLLLLLRLLLLAAGCWLLAARVWLLAAGCWQLADGCCCCC